jgi:hypothetical protein
MSIVISRGDVAYLDELDYDNGESITIDGELIIRQSTADDVSPKIKG